MSPHLAYAISTSQIALVGFSVGTAGFGYIAFPYVGHAARLWDAKKRELVSAGAGGIGDAPVKPPAWTGDPNGIELQDPPICMACIIDAEIDTEIAKEPNGIPEEKMKDQMVDLRTTASELLHQMRRTSALEGLSSSSRDRHMHSAPKKSMSRVGLDTVLEAPQKESKLYDGAATTSERTHTKTPKTELVHLTESPKILYTRPTYVSIFHPLEPSESYISSEHRPLPKWMVYLPSNRQSTIAGVRNPAAPMELPSQVRANLVQLSESLPKKQSQETCKTVAPPPSSEANGNAGSTTNVESPSPTWPATLNTSRRPSAFPFFQNPRPPMSPATESTWGPTMGPSSGMAPYIGIPSGRSSSVRTKPESVQEKSVPDKVHAIKSSAQILRSVKVLENCPVCDKAVDDCKLGRQHHRASEKSTPGTSSINIVRGCNSIPYHMACLTCHGCHVQFQPSESVSDWIWTDPKTCYHKTCLNPEVKPMLQSLVRKMSTRQVKTQQQHTDAGPLAAATNPQQEKAAVRDDPPFPIKLRSTGNGPDFHGVSRHNILSSFFSAGSTASSPRNSPRPAAKNEVQPRAALQHDRCVVCGLAIISQDSVISTGKKKAHERCVRKKKA
ncbi:MAG: hypothetical protein MMC33_003120 [Icmadophila ericetorum]|nr:hypothetical protein [Icmadophila ericetorum]